jgi:hypothetical protein
LAEPELFETEPAPLEPELVELLEHKCPEPHQNKKAEPAPTKYCGADCSVLVYPNFLKIRFLCFEIFFLCTIKMLKIKIDTCEVAAAAAGMSRAQTYAPPCRFIRFCEYCIFFVSIRFVEYTFMNSIRFVSIRLVSTVYVL